MVEAAERGEEAAIVRDGRVVAELRSVANKSGAHDVAALRRAREAATPLQVADATLLIREMRDAGDH